MWWQLFDKDNNLVGVFKGHYEMERFVKDRNIEVSATSLTKYGQHNGYSVRKTSKNCIRNCNDYPQGVQYG